MFTCNSKKKNKINNLFYYFGETYILQNTKMDLYCHDDSEADVSETLNQSYLLSSLYLCLGTECSLFLGLQ